MPGVVKKTKILIVDTAPSMAEVLKTFASQYDYEADVFSDPAVACRELHRRSTTSARAYDCVLLGWPEGKIRIIADLLGKLGTPEYADLPLIIISEQTNNDVETLVKKRENTRTLLWKDHRRASNHIESLVYQPESTHATKKPHPRRAAAAKTQHRILLVDNSPSVCHTLRDALQSNGYQVALAGTAKEALVALNHQSYDLVVANFFLRGESSEEFCRQLQSLDSDSKPVYAMMTSKNLDSVVQRSLAVGAITCLDQTESTEILLARLEAIVRGLSQQAMQREAALRDSILPSNGLSESGLREHGNQTVVSSGECLVPWSELVEMSVQPAVLIGADNLILAGNSGAVHLLAAGNAARLINIDFGKNIYSTPIKINDESKSHGQFKTVTGRDLPVTYNTRRIRTASETGVSSDYCLLTFEAQRQPLRGELEKARTGYVSASDGRTGDARAGDVTTVDKSAVLQNTESATRKPAATQKIPVKATLLDSKSIRPAIKAALDSDATNLSYHLLMLDIKIIATATGDRLSVGSSDMMLEMVKKRLAGLFTRNSTAYLGDGRFVLLLATKKAQDGLKISRNILRVIPRMMKYLTDVELVTHGSLVELPRQSSMSPQHILNHSVAACKKTELDQRDNSAFVVNKGVYLKAEVKPHPVSQAKPLAQVKAGKENSSASAEIGDAQQAESV